MKSQEDAILGQIAGPQLMNLARAVGAGWVHGDSPISTLIPFGGQAAEDLLAWLQRMEQFGYSVPQIERLIHAVVAGRSRDTDLISDLVVTGPDVLGIPTADTHAVVQSLFQEAKTEIVLAGYAFFNGRLLFERLAEYLKIRPDLKIIFHVDIPRRSNDTSSEEAIIMGYAAEFRKKHWPWELLPELYFDPRALSSDSKVRASLHAKVIVVDRSKTLITSANFTEAAQDRNIEMGLLCSNSFLSEKVCGYFEGLRQSGKLLRVPF